MKQKIHLATTRKNPLARGARTYWLATLVVFVAGGLARLHFVGSTPPLPTVPDTIVAKSESPEPGSKLDKMPGRETRVAPAMNPARPSTPASVSEPPDPNKVRQWVASLVALDMKSGSISAEQAAAWKQNLQQLIGAGSQAVPAIREFLARNQDIDLYAVPGGKQLGYDTTRQALLGALTQMGGPEAEAVLLETLHATADPAELSILARSLDTLAPGQYRDQLLSAARETLQMAANGQIAGQRDLGPLFDLLQRLGDGQSADDLLAAAKTWGYYATQTLARLPDGAGIDPLIKLATDPALGLARTTFAYQALADAAWNQPKAAETLVLEAREGHIPLSAWPSIAEALGGIQTHITDGTRAEESTLPGGERKIRWVHLEVGNQNYYATQPVAMAPDELGKRISLLDQLLALNTDQAVAAQLQQQRINLQSRFGSTPTRTL